MKRALKREHKNQKTKPTLKKRKRFHKSEAYVWYGKKSFQEKSQSSEELLC